MTLFDLLRRFAQQWLVDLDTERDRAVVFASRYGGSPALDAYLDAREAERAKHLVLMEGLEDLRRQNHPFLLLEVRPPQMLKASLRRRREAIAPAEATR